MGGSEVDWEAVAGGKGRRRVALPTYPFERKKHWIDLPAAHRTGAGRSTGPRASIERYQRLDWVAQDLAPAQDAGPAGDTTERSSWVLLGGPDKLTAELAGKLKGRGDACILVTPGERFARSGENTFRVNPESLTDFADLFAAIAPRAFPHCRGILHLWSFPPTSGGGLGPADFKQTCRNGCIAVLHALQALVRTNAKSPPRFWLLTQGAQPVAEAAPELSLSQSPLWGMGRVIGWEHPEFWGGLIPPRSPREPPMAGKRSMPK